MSEHKEIAQTIRQQLIGMDMMATWAWGCKDWSAVPSAQHEPAARGKLGFNKHLGGLHFRVNGKTFKGHVYITLNGSDLYDIKAVTPIRTNRKTLAQSGGKLKIAIKDVFVADLINNLDSFIELGCEQEDFDNACESGVRGGTY